MFQRTISTFLGGIFPPLPGSQCVQASKFEPPLIPDASNERENNRNRCLHCSNDDDGNDDDMIKFKFCVQMKHVKVHTSNTHNGKSEVNEF